MGIWGAAQAIAFGLGGFFGAMGVDGLRALLPETGHAFLVVFIIEGALFLVAAYLASRLDHQKSRASAQIDEPTQLMGRGSPLSQG